MELKYLRHNKRGYIDPKASFKAWQNEIIEPSLNIPPKDEQEKVIQLITEHFSISPELLRPFVNEMIEHRKKGYSWYADQVTKQQDSKTAQLQNELHSIKQLLSHIESGKVKTLDFKITPDFTEPVIISSPEVVAGLLRYLQTLPDGTDIKKERGRAESYWQKKYIEYVVKNCLVFLMGILPPDKLGKTDRLFFAGLILSLTGAFITPYQYFQREELDPQDGIKYYKRYITDQLKYYKPNTPGY